MLGVPGRYIVAVSAAEEEQKRGLGMLAPRRRDLRQDPLSESGGDLESMAMSFVIEDEAGSRMDPSLKYLTERILPLCDCYSRVSAFVESHGRSVRVRRRAVPVDDICFVAWLGLAWLGLVWRGWLLVTDWALRPSVPPTHCGVILTNVDFQHMNSPRLMHRYEYGMVVHAFVAAIQQLTREYTLLVAQLEHQMRIGQLTLQKLYFYIQPSLHTFEVRREQTAPLGCRNI